MTQQVKIFTGYIGESGGHLGKRIGNVLEEAINLYLEQHPYLNIQSLTPVMNSGRDWTEYSIVVVFVLDSQEKPA